MDALEMFDFGGNSVRTGVSEDGRAYVVATDLAKALGVRDAANLLRDLDVETYVGTRNVSTNGKQREVNVLYKRGVFQVLMLSRKPAAVEYKNLLFDFLEDYERHGGVLNPDRTAAQNARLAEMIRYREAQDMITLASDYAPGTRATQKVFSVVQDEMLLAVTGAHAPEIRRSREIVTWKGKAGPTNTDKGIAKNYLSSTELTQLSGLGHVVLGVLQLTYPHAGYTVQDFQNTAVEIIRAHSPR